MDTQNLKLNDVFNKNARIYQTRPVMAAKYKPGMENGFCVFYRSTGKQEGHMLWEGMIFFSNKAEAWEFINKNEMQYVNIDGVSVGIKVEYEAPLPVLYRRDANAVNLDGMHFDFTGHAFLSDESEEYEYEILDDNSWIIKENDGKIRVWNPDFGGTFFGREKEIVYEKVSDKRYVQVAV